LTGETIDLDMSTTKEIKDNLKNIALFYCDYLNTSIECKRTYGYILSCDKNYFKISYNGSNEFVNSYCDNSELLIEGLSFTLNDEGKLNSNDYIIPSSKTFNNFENDEYILIKGGSDHYIYDSLSIGK